MYCFGKSIAYSFTPLCGYDTTATTTLVSARLYDHNPTELEREDEIGALGGFVEEITSWTAGTHTNEKIITFTAFADPDPHSTYSYEDYYVVTSHKLEAGAPTIYPTESIYIYRADAWTTRITVSTTDVTTLEKTIAQLLTTTEINAHAELAKSRLFNMLRGRGYNRRQLSNLQELDQAALYYTVASCCRSLASENNQFWVDQADYFEGVANRMFDRSPVGVDVDGDGFVAPDETVTTNGVAYIHR